MAISARYLLVILLFLFNHDQIVAKFRDRKFARRCYFCPKPLDSSIRQCMKTISEMETVIAEKIGEDRQIPPLDLQRVDLVKLPNPTLAQDLMDTFAGVRCFAMMVTNFFSVGEIQRINEIELSLTEINRNPEVCVFDNFSTDCRAVDFTNTTSLYNRLQKQKILLDVLLQKTKNRK